MSKTCPKCKVSKSEEMFCKDRKLKDGLAYYCRVCVAGYARSAYQRRKASGIVLVNKWRERNLERHRELCRAGIKKWRAENPEKVRAYYQNNKERLLAGTKEYRAQNKERYALIRRNRRAMQAESGGTHTLDEVLSIHAKQSGKCAVCRVSVGKKYHVDHIVPIKRGGRNDAANLQILCPSCNVRKNAKDPIVFMRENGFLI